MRSCRNFSGAFTLAEVLITLGIIGVVAALTMPSLIQKHNNRVVETRLQKFYSAVNQAINMAETKYGDKRLWLENDAYEARREHMNNVVEDDSGISMMSMTRKISLQPGSGLKPIERPDYTNQKWIDKYLAPNMDIVKREEIISREMILLYFKDGSGLSYDGRSPDGLLWVFYPSNPKKCIDKYGDHAGGMGICKFSFAFAPEASSSSNHVYHYNKGMEPYKISWNGDKNALYDDESFGCNKNSQYKLYCTALIQANGWKIPENYPFKVRS